MTTDCGTWRELLTAEVFGEVDTDQRRALAAHREGCAACDGLAHELASTVSALALADPTGLDAIAPVPAELTERVLGALRSDSRREASRRMTFIGAIAAAVVAVAVIVGVLVSASGGVGSRAVSDALHGTPGVTATAVLSDRSWGTSLTFTESGQSGTGQYTVWMGSRSGRWWNAGTYHAVNGQRVVATMSCAVAASEITGLRVTDSSGATVLTFGSGGRYTPPGVTRA